MDRKRETRQVDAYEGVVRVQCEYCEPHFALFYFVRMHVVATIAL